MGRVLLAVVLAALTACRAAPPEPLVEDPQLVSSGRAAPVVRFSPVGAARPELNIEQLIPDFHAELRWPLSPMTHPVLEPHYDIASVFAQPGVRWTDLCQRGAQNRQIAGRLQDEQAYLRGWCAALKGDPDAACAALVPLLRSPVLGMSAAVRVDLANILVAHGDADKAEHLLEVHNVRDIEVVDLLAASYYEVGRLDDAYALNRRALGSDATPSPPTHCRRLVRDLVLGGDRVARMLELDRYATTLDEPTCVALLHAARCWAAPGMACEDHFQDSGIDPSQAVLLEAYRAWPAKAVNAETWLPVAMMALRAMPSPEAEALATVALDAAMRSAPGCAPPVIRTVEIAAKKQIPRFVEEVARCRRKH